MLFGAFNAIDMAALVIAMSGLLLGLRRGLSGEWLRFVNVVIILLAGLRGYLPLGDLFIANTRLSHNPEQARALAFLLIVLVLGLCLLVIRMLLHLVMNVVFAEKTNRVGGGLLGLVRGVLVVFLVVFAAGLWPHPYLRQVFVRDSVVGRTVFRISPLAVETVNSVHLQTDKLSAENQ